MSVGVILLNFGEPEQADPQGVLSYLERIFALNATLEAGAPAARARELAGRRAPALIEAYRRIGGSPLNAQARAQGAALENELRERGIDAHAHVGFQFTDPGIGSAAKTALQAGATRIIGLPVHPLCGPTTTVAALRELAAYMERHAPDVDYREVSGWHAHPLYLRMRADGILATCAGAGLELNAETTRLVFSAHGTPISYLRAGSRYDAYVEECCREIAARTGAERYVIGYQNHGNRPVQWTQPDIEDVVRTVEARAIVVVPVSFMHEQSETLAELDLELRETAAARGLDFHRVPVPHDDARFACVLADLVIARLENGPLLRACACRADPRTCCTNGR